MQSIWEGERVRLREIEPEDWTVYAAWNRDDAMWRSLEGIPFPGSDARVRAWAEKEAQREWKDDRRRLVMVAKDSGGVVGDVTIHTCDPLVGTLSYGLNVLESARRQGYASEAIKIVLRYYFFERRYQKANVGIFEFSEASIALHQKLGFQPEGRLRRTVFSNGRHWDELLFGITIEEFAALDDKG
jgi:RimJ/RimL family protein N-acetyltransferase